VDFKRLGLPIYREQLECHRFVVILYCFGYTIMSFSTEGAMANNSFFISVAALLAVAISSATFAPITPAVFAAPVADAKFSKKISLADLASYDKKTVVVKEGGKEVKYEGVPLRTFLKEFLPESKLDDMPDRKEIARRELVMEVTADDKYPGLVTALEVAMNDSGDKFILATARDGKALEGVQMICKLDEMHARWVHNVVRLRLVEVPKATD
jgi:hypothetical protein